MLRPPTSGQWQVSALTLEIPFRNPRSIHGERYFLPDGRPALNLRTLLLTIYYPTSQPDKASKGTISWLNSPRLKSVEGLLKYAGMSRWFALPSIIPAYQVFLQKLPFFHNAPLAQTQTSLPTVLFAHGLGGTATTYSSLLSNIASHGCVVGAVESRDGTAPCTEIHDPVTGKSEAMLYFKEEEVTKPGSSKGGKFDFRQAQLEMRRAELEEAVSVLQRINAGEGAKLLAAHTRQHGRQDLEKAKLAEWQDCLDLKDGITYMAHSFGGAAVLSSIALGSQSPTKVQRALLLDPWLEPLSSVLIPPTSASRKDHVPVYIINSQHFTVWQSHFEQLRRICSDVAKTNQQNRSPATGTAPQEQGWLCTLTGSKHTDFSDFPFLIPRLFRSDVDPNEATRIFEGIAKRVILREEVFSEEEESQTQQSDTADSKGVPMKWEKEGEVRSKDLGKAGQVIRHYLGVPGERKENKVKL